MEQSFGFIREEVLGSNPSTVDSFLLGPGSQSCWLIVCDIFAGATPTRLSFIPIHILIFIVPRICAKNHHRRYSVVVARPRKIGPPLRSLQVCCLAVDADGGRTAAVRTNTTSRVVAWNRAPLTEGDLGSNPSTVIEFFCHGSLVCSYDGEYDILATVQSSQLQHSPQLGQNCTLIICIPQISTQNQLKGDVV